METAPNETASELKQLAEEVRALERRVRALELAIARTPSESGERSRELPPPIALPAIAPSASLSIGMVPVWGRAAFGLAGAFLLRALAESGRFPRMAVVVASIVYATVWLVTSCIRSNAAPGRMLARMVYATTAALIFFPMLWETTTQFRLLSPLAAGMLLVVFAAVGSALAWYRNASGIAWVTAIPGSAIAMVLMLSTGELGPLVGAMLAICAMVEAVDVRDRWSVIHPAAAFFADAGVASMIYIHTRPHHPEAYRQMALPAAVGLCFLLLGIYLISVGFRTVILRDRIKFLETAQITLTFAFAFAGSAWMTQETGLFGVFSILGASFFYGIALRRFGSDTSGRNHRVYAALGLSLLIAGSIMLFPKTVVIVLEAGLGVVAALTASQTRYRALALHAAIYLAVSVVLSGLLSYSMSAMTDSSAPARPSGEIWTVALGAVLIYLACSRGPANKWVRLVAAVVIAVSTASIAVALIAGFPARISGSWLPAMRTLILCALSMAAIIGTRSFSRRRRVAERPDGEQVRPVEWIWTAYGAAAVVMVKLFVQDFRQSSPAALAISLLCVGTLLILGPRLLRPGSTTRS